MRSGLISTGVSLAAVLAVSGCMSSPTYGTGKTANEQLFEDIGSSMQLTPKKGPKVNYTPRPELLKTAKASALPEPQQNVTRQEGVWPESPEEKRARLRQEATDNQGNPNFEPTIYDDTIDRTKTVLDSPDPNSADRDPRKRVTSNVSAKVKELRKENVAGSPTTRKHLSEPPLEYRQPTDTATYGDFGEDEAKKERAARAAAKKGKGWKWPWQ